MSVRLRKCILAAACAAALTPAFAQRYQKPDVPAQGSSKEQMHEEMRNLAREIEALRASHGSALVIAQLTAQYEALSQSLGGDRPANLPAAGGAHAATTLPHGTALPIFAPPCGGSATTTTNFAGTTGPILPLPFTGATYTTTVSGVGTYLWDVNLLTTITHTAMGDLDITLQSPAGTTVTISTDIGGVLDNTYNGTTFDDNVNDPATDHVYTNLVTATPLSPEGRLQAFRGQDPNGTWTLRIIDDTAANVGTLSAWSLDITTAAAPAEATTTISRTPNIPIPDVMTITDTMAVGGLGTYLTKVEVYMEVLHTFAADLDITLTSPSGTVIQVTTDNGGGNDNVFNGTLFSPSALDPVTDHVYTNLVVATPLSPEGAFDNFLGQNPNGNWILTVTDDLGIDTGTLVRWDLNITTTGAAPATAGPTNFAGTTGAIPDFPPFVATPTTYTSVVGGMGPYLWDLDLNTSITHTSSADIDMTLTSPAGTVVRISTDNGGANDNCFNGTRWDDTINDPAMDHVYTNLVTATPLTSEGSITAFRGEDPNGTWTLTITDDASADSGSLNGWSLDVTTMGAGPIDSPTTVTQSPALAILDVATVFDTMAVAGVNTYLTKVELYVEILHTYAADLDITLTSPAGTVVQVTSDNGGVNDNVFNGTLFTPSSVDPVTDHVYVNLVVATPLSPEGSFDNFTGQDPNGNWVLTITDDAAIDVGTLVRWDLNLRTCAGVPGVAYCFGDGSTATPCPCGNVGATGRGCATSFNAAGARLYADGQFANEGGPVGSGVILRGEGMNLTANQFCIFLMGSVDAPAGIVFGDGVRCADAPLLRMRTEPITPNALPLGGTSSFPMAGDPQSLSVRGSSPVGSTLTRYYTVYYRNSAAGFCPPDTFNTSNGYKITW